MTSGSFWAFTPELLNEKRGTAWSMKEQENRHYGWMRADTAYTRRMGAATSPLLALHMNFERGTFVD